MSRSPALMIGFWVALISLALLVGFHDTVFGGYFWHPLRLGDGYNAWSGVLGSFLFSLPGFAVAIAVWWRTHNCHVQGCWRLQWHPHPGHGHPVCAVHHPYGQGRGKHLKAEHHRDHSDWPGLLVHPFHAESSNVSFSGISYGVTGGVDAQVGDAVPEKPKRERVRKPGTDEVTDLDSKRPS